MRAEVEDPETNSSIYEVVEGQTRAEKGCHTNIVSIESETKTSREFSRTLTNVQPHVRKFRHA